MRLCGVCDGFAGHCGCCTLFKTYTGSARKCNLAGAVLAQCNLARVVPATVTWHVQCYLANVTWPCQILDFAMQH